MKRSLMNIPRFPMRGMEANETGLTCIRRGETPSIQPQHFLFADPKGTWLRHWTRGADEGFEPACPVPLGGRAV